MSENLVSGLSGEIERVSNKAQRWRSMMEDHPSLAGGMSLGLSVMDATLKAARDALASGDPLTMMPAYLSLKDYSDDD